MLNVRLYEQRLYWAHMASDAYATVHDCYQRLQHRANEKKKRQPELFFLNGSLEYVDMEILAPLLKTKQGNQFVIIMTARYAKLTKAVSTQNTNTQQSLTSS